MGRTFVIGDIHGAYRALRQCLEKSRFDYEADYLICLGDVADGWPETRQVVDELLRVRNLTFLLGNHDWWALQWMRAGKVEQIWYDQGGKATIDSYQDGIPDHHITMLSEAAFYHIVDNKLFLFYNKFFNNTLKSWNKDEARLKKSADAHWKQIFN